jgi:hypothetical protein
MPVELELSYDIIDKYVNNKRSIISLSKEYKCGQGSIKRFLVRNNISIRNIAAQAVRHRLLTEADRIDIQQLYESGKTIKSIAKLYGSPMPTMLKYFNRFGIDYTSRKNVMAKMIANKELIVKMYNDGQICEILQKFDCSAWALHYFLDKFKIPRCHSQSARIISPTEYDNICNLYVGQKMSCMQISKIYNCTQGHIREILIRHNINRRTKTENGVLVMQNPETQKKQWLSSLRCKDYMLPSGNVVKLQGYEPQFLDYIFTNKILKDSQIEYNPKRIPYIENNKTRYYFPDFYIPHLNLIVEVKSKYILNKMQGVNNCMLKENATKAAGFDYIMVLENDFSKLEEKLSYNRLNN